MDNDSNMDKYSKFDESIQKKINDINIDLAEGILDSITESEILKQIPIVKILVSTLEIGNSLRQHSYYKKIYRFLFELDTVNKDEKDKFIKELEKKGDKKRVYDNILLILDKFDDEDKASIAGKLFRAAIEGEIEMIMFFRLINIVEKIYFGDLDLFRIKYQDRYSHDKEIDYDSMISYENEYVKENLANHGLLKRYYSQDKSLEKYRGRPSDSVQVKDYGVSQLGEILIKFGF